MENNNKFSLFDTSPKDKVTSPDLFSPDYWRLRESNSQQDQNSAKERALEAQVSKESAISYNNVSIVSLSGQEITNQDILGKKMFWESDLYPNLENELLKKEFSPIGGKASWFGGEAKLWNHLAETAEQIKKESGIELDIHNLTPTEAIYLIKELVRRRLNYDDIIAENVTKKNIEQGNIVTARPELLDYFSKNPKKFKAKALKYSEELSQKTADQIISHGYGVCRHIAAVSSILYEILRNNQESILMNSSYLLYHDEEKGSQKVKASVDGHAYNILYTVRPTESQNPEVLVSVLDPTAAVVSSQIDENMDYTWLRISQACSSLYEYGRMFGVQDHKKVVSTLAGIACERLKKYIFTQSPNFYSFEDELGIEEHLNDYISLELQRGHTEVGSILDSVYPIYQHYGEDRSTMVLHLLKNPPIAYISSSDTLKLNTKWLPELIFQIKKCNITNNVYSDRMIYQYLQYYAENISIKDLEKDKTGNLLKFLEVYHQISKSF